MFITDCTWACTKHLGFKYQNELFKYISKKKKNKPKQGKSYLEFLKTSR